MNEPEPEPENYLARLEKLASDDSGLARLRKLLGNMDPEVVANLLKHGADAGDDEMRHVLDHFQHLPPVDQAPETLPGEQGASAP